MFLSSPSAERKITPSLKAQYQSPPAQGCEAGGQYVIARYRCASAICPGVPLGLALSRQGYLGSLEQVPQPCEPAPIATAGVVEAFLLLSARSVTRFRCSD